VRKDDKPPSQDRQHQTNASHLRMNLQNKRYIGRLCCESVHLGSEVTDLSEQADDLLSQQAISPV
jgi:hypothetical protein